VELSANNEERVFTVKDLSQSQQGAQSGSTPCVNLWDRIDRTVARSHPWHFLCSIPLWPSGCPQSDGAHWTCGGKYPTSHRITFIIRVSVILYNVSNCATNRRRTERLTRRTRRSCSLRSRLSITSPSVDHIACHRENLCGGACQSPTLRANQRTRCERAGREGAVGTRHQIMCRGKNTACMTYMTIP
jgi:hypothetical protein